MKYRRLLLFVSLLSQSLSFSWGMMQLEEVKSSTSLQATDTSETYAVKIENLHTAIQKALKTMEENPHYEMTVPRIIVIGNTGSGKTTLIHLLAGKSLLAQQILHSKRYWLEVAAEELLPGFHIGHSVRAGTALPVSWHELTTNMVFGDCPGFGDPAGPEREIINACAIYQLFKSSAPTKLVVVTTENEANIEEGRATAFLHLLKRVTDVLAEPSKPESQLPSLSLVVTKQRDYELQELIENINAALDADNTHEFHQGPVKGLLNTLVPPERKVGMPAPSQVGQYFSETRANILETILATEAMVAPKVNIALSSEAKLLLSRYVRVLNERICNFVSNDISQSVADYCHQLIDNHQSPAKDLRLKLKHVHDSLAAFKDNLRNLEGISDQDFKSELNKIFTAELEVFSHSSSLKKMLEIMFSLKMIDQAITYNIDSWAIRYEVILKKIKQLMHVDSKFVNGELLINGYVLGLTDLSEVGLRLIGSIPDLCIKVMAHHTLLFDTNISYPGVSLHIIAPSWKILDRRLINLSGIAGADGRDGAGFGQDGHPGKPGKNGGNFYGKGRTFHNTTGLTIETNGGPGGKGSHGADGSCGRDGKDGDLTLKTKQGNTYYYHDRGTDGQAGGNGGRGGHGGQGGFKGEVIIEGNHDWQLVAADGPVGAHGKGGLGGTGGRHGRNCQGTLITDRIKEESFQEVQMITGRTEERRVPVERTMQTPGWLWFVPGPGLLIKSIDALDVAFKPVAYRTESVALPDLPVIETHTRTVAAEDQWQVLPGYQEDRGKAADGCDGSGLNTDGQDSPAPQTPLDKPSILAIYNSYHQEAKNSLANQFVRNID